MNEKGKVAGKVNKIKLHGKKVDYIIGIYVKGLHGNRLKNIS